MKNRDKLKTCQRCHRKSETVLKFEELFEKVERKGEPTDQIQTEHDERLLEALV